MTETSSKILLHELPFDVPSKKCPQGKDLFGTQEFRRNFTRISLISQKKHNGKYFLRSKQALTKISELPLIGGLHEMEEPLLGIWA
jgi:hypothetical protein